jgi:hypothetical protein
LKHADSGIVAAVLERFPFYYRVALLVGLMAVAAGVDLWRHGREATKYRDSVLNAEQIARFRRVWWIHTGLYAGLAAGLAAIILGATDRENKNARIT